MASAEVTSDPFLVAPITGVDVTSAAVGDRVVVKSNATSGQADPFAVVTIYWDSLAGVALGSGTADNFGNYSITVTVPESTAGTHWIIANDGETESGGTQITVTPTLSVDSVPPAWFPPTLALPGDELTVTGQGYAPNDDIVLFLNTTTLVTPASYVITTPAFETDSMGSFSGTIVVPAIPMANFDMYEFNATDEAGNTAVDQVSIDYYITCYPSSGPTGIEIMIYGRIAPSVAYNLRFNGALIATGTTGSDGSYFETYVIPAVLSPATYPIDIWWATTENRSTTFTVTPTPTIVLGASSGIAGQVVSITGSNFVNMADITLYFDGTIVNSTSMGTGFGPTNFFGGFSEEFVVPALPPATYAVSVVDSYGATSAAGVFFSITPTPVVTVETRALEYFQGDLMSLYTWTNIVPTDDIYWEIHDPTGCLFAFGDIYTSDWYMTAPMSYCVPYMWFRISTYFNNQIPNDAQTGVWNFTAYWYSSGMIVDTNLFAVNAKPDMQDVLDKIDECCSNMTTLLMELGANITAIDGAVATVSTTVGDIDVALSDIDAKITSIEGDVATIDSTIGNFDAKLSSLESKITSVSGDMATVETNIGAVKTKVDSLDLTIGGLYGDIITINTTLGTLEGTITGIEGDVATILTDVGELKVDVAALQTDVTSVQSDVEESLPVAVDMMPVWIAVVLSLIAAIAAIFAVVTIRQKIAG
jgi:flagellin-like hook-associated protein FlgL